MVSESGSVLETDVCLELQRRKPAQVSRKWSGGGGAKRSYLTRCTSHSQLSGK